jgi:hypothetical protein
MLNRKENIYWCPFLLGGDWHNVGYFEPEPVLKYITTQRDTEVEYLKCPAFQEYFSNTFLIRSPVDLQLQVEKDTDGRKILTTKNFNQKFYNDHIFPRMAQNNVFSMFSLEFSYIFYSEKSVIIEMIPASMEKTKFIQNTNLIPGEYDISKWIRPVSPAFEIVNDSEMLSISRGDPLFYIRFKSDKKINLIRVEQDSIIENIEKACARLKFFVPKNTLDENYKAAKSMINLYKPKLFKKKCPFHFWKKT